MNSAVPQQLMKPESGGGLLLLRRSTPLTRRHTIYFCSGAYTGSRLLALLEAGSYEGLGQTVERIRRIFDLGADPIQIASHLSRDPKLRQLVRRRPVLRVPGVWDGFEAAVLAVLGQKLTMPGSKRVVTRLVQVFGTPVNTPVRGLKYLFPRPEILVHADLSKAGISDSSARVLRKLACSTMRKHLTFSTLRTLERTVSQLAAVHGIDESTAHYIAMRAFGEPDAFPAKEPGLRRRLAELMPIASPVHAIHVAERWRPWRAYAAMHWRLS
jgi:AraC family transcriptional regulator of adaptative response / DNA-3-methyladenine glycosylase II